MLRDVLSVFYVLGRLTAVTPSAPAGGTYYSVIVAVLCVGHIAGRSRSRKADRQNTVHTRREIIALFEVYTWHAELRAVHAHRRYDARSVG